MHRTWHSMLTLTSVKLSLLIVNGSPLLVNIRNRLPSSFSLLCSTSSRQTQSIRDFTSTSPMADAKGFIDAVKARRTRYQISNESPISDDRIVELVETAIHDVPSSFNSQSTRVLVLLKKEHEKLWDITKEILKTQVPDEKSFKEHTEPRINGFRGGYGTVWCPPIAAFTYRLLCIYGRFLDPLL